MTVSVTRYYISSPTAVSITFINNVSIVNLILLGNALESSYIVIYPWISLSVSNVFNSYVAKHLF